MSAYVIVEVQVNNEKEYEDYKKLTPGSVSAYDGKFIVRGGRAESLEGDWNPQRIVVLEFPSVEKAKEWWASKEYAPAKQIRQNAAATRMLVIEGYN